MNDAVIQEIETLIPVLRRFARSLTRDVHRADDLVQDTLERALTKLDHFEEGTNLRAWLFTIMRHRFISDCRRTSRAPVVDADENHFDEQVVPASQDHAVELKEFERAYAALDRGEREILALAGLEGLPYGDIAEILDVAVGTVKSRVARARTKLRALVAENGAIAGQPLVATQEQRLACAS